MSSRIRLALITPPSVEPVTLAETKAWLKVDGTDDDALITSLITAARTSAEDYTRRAFITQAWRQSLDLSGWGMGDGLPEGVYDLPSTVLYCALPRLVELLRPPVISITTVTTYSTSNVAAVYSSANYSLINDRLVQLNTATWPSDVRQFGALEVVTLNGYGASAASVPEPIKTAIKMHVMKMYDGRTICEMPPACEQLLRRYRITSLR